jgi:hypothetical protein
MICLLLIIDGCSSSGGGGDADELVPATGSEDDTAQESEPVFKMWKDSEIPQVIYIVFIVSER